MLSLAITLFSISMSADSAKNAVLFNGNSQILYYTPDFWEADDPYINTEFTIRSFTSSKDLLVTSFGLGTVKFEVDSIVDKANELKIAKLTSQPLAIKIAIPVSHLRHDGDVADGKIQVSTDTALLAVMPIKIIRPQAGPIKVAWLWFLGIIAPALVAAGLGYVGSVTNAAREAKQKEKQVLEKFKRDNREQLQIFFRTFLAVSKTNHREDDEGFIIEMDTELEGRNVYKAINAVDYKDIQDCVGKRDRDGMLRILANNFPEYKVEILK